MEEQMPDTQNLPNAENAVIEQTKILEYLLSPEHADGRSKAEFFMRFGFSREDWKTFSEALRQHGGAYPVNKTVEFEYGTRYVVEGELMTPDGRNPYIRTVWMIDKEETGDSANVPRLVTAYRP